MNERVKEIRKNTIAMNGLNKRLGSVSKVLDSWEKQDKFYHTKKEKSDNRFYKILVEILKVLKKKIKF